ncbi:DUF7852 domain-containing protein [Clostridium hydrogenum]|uniref:DUF7852 domain-containing protein n=1 Tax=Clostridium hydrogenum TaxID=2855764 RepID=UPI001F42612F|nr:hypothetical protein [Clostridium hydrogenum]
MSHRKHHKKDDNSAEFEISKEGRKKMTHSHDERRAFEVYVNEKNENNCRLQLISSKMVMECTSKVVRERKKEGFIAVRMPVVITEVMVNINIQNTIQFTRNVINLISIKRKVLLKQCKLIPEANKLFLNGIVIKSIEYNEEVVHSDSNSRGRVKNITVNIPFQCVTRVEYINEPKMEQDKKEETKVFKMINGEQTFVDSYSETDEIYCELVKVTFNELNINGGNNAIVGGQSIHTFKKFKQKMAMKLTVRLVQKQDLFIRVEGKE